MSIIVLPFTFSAGAVIIASQHNSNFSTIYSDYNGNVDNTNIVANAGILASKLNQAIAGPIGATTPNTGKFTTLEATGAATLDTTLNVTGATTLSGTLNLGSTHQGDVLYDNGTNIVRLTPGTNGQFLQTQGASANPQWGTVSNTYALTSSTALSSVATTGNVLITSGNQYMVMFNLTGFTNGDQLILRFNADSGSDYKYISTGFTTTAAISSNSASATAINLGRAISGGGSVNGIFYIQQAASQIYRVWGQVIFDDTTSSLFAMMSIAGTWGNSANVTSFVISNTNNISGAVNLYQIKTS